MAEDASPIVNALNRPFWNGADLGELRLPHCRDTGAAFWPPSPASPFTGGPVDWHPCDPLGEVESVVVYRRPFQQAFAALLPYGIALVGLRAGPRLLAHVETPHAPGAPRVGSTVEIRFRRLIEGPHPLPVAVIPTAL
jgi:uncharacterized OB-fold protein